MGGQSVCSGCGSDAMLCGLVSLLTNSTREPCDRFTCVGLTPDDEIVMVVSPPGGFEGDDGLPPPPHAPTTTRTIGNSRRIEPLCIGRRSSVVGHRSSVIGYRLSAIGCRSSDQKNFLEMLNPMNHELLSTPPRAI